MKPPIFLQLSAAARSYARHSAFAAWTFALSYCPALAAQTAASAAATTATAETADPNGAEEPSSTEPSPRDHLVVYLSLNETTLQPQAIFDALEEEFKIPVTRSEQPAGLRLVVHNKQLSASYVGDDGSKVERELTLPEQSSTQILTIRLLSGSIARDEAGALLALLKAPAPPPPPKEESSQPAPEPEEASPTPVSKDTLAQEKPKEPPPEATSQAAPPEKLPPPLPTVPASASFSGGLSYPQELSKKATRLHVGFLSSDIGSLKGLSATFISHRNRGLDRNGAGSGVQLAVAALHTGGDFKGINLAAMVGSGVGTLDGVQASGLFSLQRGDMKGVQLTGLVSARTGDLQGIQLGGLGAFQLGKLEGLQAAGLASFNGSDLLGFQAAGLVAINGGHLEGAQMAMFGTYSHRGLHGYQMGFINVARQQLEGWQVGLINVAGDFNGTQIGLLNIGGNGKGNQIGLMNIAKDLKGVALAPVNIIPKMRNQLLAYTSYFPSGKLEGTPKGPMVHVGVKFLPSVVYSQLSLGLGLESEECLNLDNADSSSARCHGDRIVYAPSFAVGARSKWGKVVYLDLDGQYQFVRGTNSSRSSLHQLLGRATLGVEFSPLIGAFIGGGPRLDFYEGPRVPSPPDVTLGWHAFGGLSFF